MNYRKANKLHIVAVTAVIRRDDGRYLVLKRSEREIAFPGKWCFAGGKVEDNDTVDETLAAEAKEEAGLTIKPGKVFLKDATFMRPDGQSVKLFSYLCQVESTAEVVISEDFTDHRWITPAELSELDHVGLEEEVRRAEQLLALPPEIQATLQTISQRDE